MALTRAGSPVEDKKPKKRARKVAEYAKRVQKSNRPGVFDTGPVFSLVAGVGRKKELLG